MWLFFYSCTTFCIPPEIILILFLICLAFYVPYSKCLFFSSTPVFFLMNFSSQIHQKIYHFHFFDCLFSSGHFYQSFRSDLYWLPSWPTVKLLPWKFLSLRDPVWHSSAWDLIFSWILCLPLLGLFPFFDGEHSPEIPEKIPELEFQIPW